MIVYTHDIVITFYNAMYTVHAHTCTCTPVYGLCKIRSQPLKNVVSNVSHYCQTVGPVPPRSPGVDRRRSLSAYCPARALSQAAGVVAALGDREDTVRCGADYQRLRLQRLTRGLPVLAPVDPTGSAGTSGTMIGPGPGPGRGVARSALVEQQLQGGSLFAV